MVDFIHDFLKFMKFEKAFLVGFIVSRTKSTWALKTHLSEINNNFIYID